MVMTFINGRLVKRIGLLPMLRLGLCLASVAGLILLLNSATGWGGLWGVVLPVVAYIGQMGVIGANATSHALGFFPANAGTAAALAGTLRFGAGALAGVAVNCLPTDSPVPMAVVMAIGILFALFFHLWMQREPGRS